MNVLDKRLLCAIITNHRLALDFSNQCNDKFFLDSDAKVLASVMLKYVKTYRSPPTKRALLESTKETAIQNIINKFWAEIENDNYNEADYNFDLEQFKNRYIEMVLSKLQKSLYEENNIKNGIKLTELAVNEIRNVNKKDVFVKKTLKEHSSDFKQEYMAKCNDSSVDIGILTGYSLLDYIRNGLRPADLWIICSETSGGKSMFLNNIAIQTWMQNNKIDSENYTKGYNVIYFSLEMPYQECHRRTLARLSDVPMYGIRDATLNELQGKNIAKALKFIDNYPCEFDIVDVPRGFSVKELELLFEEAKAKYNPDVVFIDYMGLMEDISTDEYDWLAQGQLAGKIHEFARAYQVPVITAVQLNRLSPREKQEKIKQIGLHRIGRSSMIAHHATLVLQIEFREEEAKLADFVYHIIKNRDGINNASTTIHKNFARASIIDKQFTKNDLSGYENVKDDISAEMANIVGNIISE